MPFPIAQFNTSLELLFITSFLAIFFLITSSFITSLLTFRTVTSSRVSTLTASLSRVTHLFCFCCAARIHLSYIRICSLFVATRCHCERKRYRNGSQ